MAIQKELWLPVIEENFYSNWGILSQLAKDDSVYVMRNGSHVKVHIPNAGAGEDILKNNTSYPVSVVERTDVTVEYDVDSFQLPPVRVGHYDAAMLSYDKLSSVTKDLMGGIGEHIMLNSFVNWYIGKETGKFVETSDTGNTATSDAPASTTTVLGLGQADVKKAAKILDLQKVPATGRILLLAPQMFYQLHDSIIEKFDIVDNDGMLMLDKPFYGFSVRMTHTVLNVESDGTARPVGNAGATSDLQVGFAYQKDQVSIAKEQTFVYSAEDRPEYYGDIISSESFAGASYRRYDKKGIVPILQKAE